MARIVLLAVALLTAVWAADQADGRNVLDPDGWTAPLSDGGNGLDPNGATTNGAGGAGLDPNG